MKKRTISYICHSIFWNSLLFLPVIFLCFFTISGLQFQSTSASFGSNLQPLNFMYSLCFNTPYGQVINSFVSNNIFGVYTYVDGASCFFSVILTWFVTVELFHLLYDFIFFLPKVIYKFIKSRFKL